MRAAGLLAFACLASCRTGYARPGIRPLRPLELATAAYADRVTDRLVGSLSYEGGCLLFHDERTGAVVLPVWPVGSIFNGTAVIFHRPGKADQPIQVTQQVMVQGSAAQWASLAASTYAPFERQCGASPFFVARVHPAD